MSVIILVGIVAVGVVGYGVYQVIKGKKAVTVGNVVTAVKADAAQAETAVKADVKKA
jgi:hypothetical protein